jgi:hypothetical protein
MTGRLGPAGLTAIAVVVGWAGVYFAFQSSWLGVALPLVTTALTWTAVRQEERILPADGPVRKVLTESR